jgi:predicted dinucleotide-binding enzyme
VKVAVIGSGMVGEALANGFKQHGEQVMRASRDPHKLAEWKERAGPLTSIGTFAEAAAWGEVVVLAVKGTAAEEAIGLCDPLSLAGKTVIDVTNPIADAAPEEGVLCFFTVQNQSLMERLQARAPAAHFVKAFSCVGAGHMVNPDFGSQRPTMFICGDDARAKATVSGILERFGWEPEDLGAVQAARAIEALCMLWCIPGLRHGRWNHAFKLLKK